jgi:hypothetical protein
MKLLQTSTGYCPQAARSSASYQGGHAMGKLGLVPSAAALGCAIALAGCGTFGSPSPTQDPMAAQPAPMPEIPATIRSSEIVGRWGYAAYHKPEDRTRTEAAARGQCNHPFVIGQGASGGVMMLMADSPQPQELRLKGSQGGKNFIGPAGEGAGGPQDREVVSFDGRVMVLRYVDPEIASRYGFGVFVRCAPRA